MKDSFPIRRVDHIRHYVGNARQAAFYYQHIFGFNITGFHGLETGQRHEVDYLLEQDRVKLLFSAPIRPEHPMSAAIARHGDFVQDIAFEVDDVDWSFAEAVRHGASPAKEPFSLSDADGEVRIASIHTYGDTLHTFINRDKFKGHFLPHFERLNQPGDPIGLVEIDHCVGNVELGAMNTWVHWYEDVLGFKQLISFDDKEISTEFTALMSKVMANGNGRVKFPINEPAEGKRRSQIEEYLEYYHGPGVQHIAMATNDIVQTVSQLQAQGVGFLKVPHSYYSELESRVGRIDEPLDELESLGILVDRDDEGYMLQIFTRPVEDRPTLFFEIIQRKGSRSFGKGNFKALFEAIEREQEARGNL